MVINTGENRRIGAQSKRAHVQNPLTDQWVKFSDETGKIMANKENIFKGVHPGIVNKRKRRSI